MRLAARCQQAGPKIRQQMTRTLRRTAKQLVPLIKEAAHEKFPNAGGMDEFIEHATIGVRIQTSGRSAGLYIRAERKGHDIYSLNQGNLRHPVFGNRAIWVSQSIPPGFFTETIEENRQRVIADLRTDMAVIARSLTT